MKPQMPWQDPLLFVMFVGIVVLLMFSFSGAVG